MWANVMPGRCAYINMSKNNLSARLIARPLAQQPCCSTINILPFNSEEILGLRASPGEAP